MRATAATVGAGTAAIAQILPAATWLPPVRRALAPALCGPGPAGTVVREIAARGHQVAVHGWWHRNQLLRPGGVHGQLRRAAEQIGELTGAAPIWYRPPYGVLSGEGLLAARRLGLRPVLWSAWGKDWTADATPERVVATVRDGLVDGATILLHDTDAYSHSGSWRATLGALPAIVGLCRERGLRAGGLSAGTLGAGDQAGSSGSGGS